MSYFSDSLIESDCTLLLTIVAECLQSAMTVIAECQYSAENVKPKFWMIHSVDSPLQIFLADCGQRESVYLPYSQHSPSNW